MKKRTRSKSKKHAKVFKEDHEQSAAKDDLQKSKNHFVVLELEPSAGKTQSIIDWLKLRILQ